MSDETTEKDLSPAYQEAVSLVLSGRTRNQVAVALHEGGLDKPTAIQITLEVFRARGEALHREGRRNMTLGGLFFVGGLALTLFTYAKASGSGGSYVLAYGPVIFGGIQLVRGLSATSKGEKMIRASVAP